MKAIRFVFVLALAACSMAPTVVDEARKRFDEGRGEEALALLQKAAKENDPTARAAYARMRDLVVGQWLSQAEALRQGGQFEAAATLYSKVQVHDSANARAAAGLAQIEADRRHRAIVASVEQLVRAGKYREAQDALRPLLTENPQQRDARRLQRAIDD